jgi:hypothetical protein
MAVEFEEQITKHYCDGSGLKLQGHGHTAERDGTISEMTWHFTATSLPETTETFRKLFAAHRFPEDSRAVCLFDDHLETLVGPLSPPELQRQKQLEGEQADAGKPDPAAS